MTAATRLHTRWPAAVYSKYNIPTRFTALLSVIKIHRIEHCTNNCFNSVVFAQIFFFTLIMGDGSSRTWHETQMFLCSSFNFTVTKVRIYYSSSTERWAAVQPTMPSRWEIFPPTHLTTQSTGQSDQSPTRETESLVCHTTNPHPPPKRTVHYVTETPAWQTATWWHTHQHSPADEADNMTDHTNRGK